MNLIFFLLSMLKVYLIYFNTPPGSYFMILDFKIKILIIVNKDIKEKRRSEFLLYLGALTFSWLFRIILLSFITAADH